MFDETLKHNFISEEMDVKIKFRNIVFNNEEKSIKVLLHL